MEDSGENAVPVQKEYSYQGREEACHLNFPDHFTAFGNVAHINANLQSCRFCRPGWFDRTPTSPHVAAGAYVSSAPSEPPLETTTDDDL
jgi:hypothetical protein